MLMIVIVGYWVQLGVHCIFLCTLGTFEIFHSKNKLFAETYNSLMMVYCPL